MEHYIVYWPQDVVNALKKAKDEGPIKVVYGSIHSRMPSIASVREGGHHLPCQPDQKSVLCDGKAARGA